MIAQRTHSKRRGPNMRPSRVRGGGQRSFLRHQAAAASFERSNPAQTFRSRVFYFRRCCPVSTPFWVLLPMVGSVTADLGYVDDKGKSNDPSATHMRRVSKAIRRGNTSDPAVGGGHCIDGSRSWTCRCMRRRSVRIRIRRRFARSRRSAGHGNVGFTPFSFEWCAPRTVGFYFC